MSFFSSIIKKPLFKGGFFLLAVWGVSLPLQGEDLKAADISSPLPSEDSPLNPSVPSLTMIPANTIILRGLDKITGKVFNIKISPHQKVKFGSLDILINRAFCNPPEIRPECAAQVTILEEEKVLFKGWMFASNPAVSALEHPVYDIWVAFS